MKQFVIAMFFGLLMAATTTAAKASIEMSLESGQAVLGESVQFECETEEGWQLPLMWAKIIIKNGSGTRLVNRAPMDIDGDSATYDYMIPSQEQIGNWKFICVIQDGSHRERQVATFSVVEPTVDPPEPPVEPPPEPENSPPVAGDDSAETAYENLVIIDILANDSDVDDNIDPSTLIVTTLPGSGSAQIGEGDKLQYTPGDGFFGVDSLVYQICDRDSSCDTATVTVTVAEPPVEPPVDPPPQPPGDYELSHIQEHNDIYAYDGPSTCIACHETEASQMLQSLHAQWSGPTPDLSNTDGASLGKAKGGINTFCTYAMSSKSACFTCHVRVDGNAPDEPAAEDVDCLMCHSDTYQRTFVVDEANSETVRNTLGELKTYKFGKVDDSGNYITEPDFTKMPAGTNMVNVARMVHMPTSASCLRCHAKAGGSDWAKRGDMGLNSANPTVEQDVHLAKDGANLACVNCHSALNHKISGRGIDLRQTEAAAPTCSGCHSSTPHSSSTLNRHAQGQVSCQVCHIRNFAKGGATEMSRDWSSPVWNDAFCGGQGGFVGHEVKQSNVQPEYVWFDGTSYVYNVGERIDVDERGVLPMARANGAPFDGKSKIVPIKRHFSKMPLDTSGKIIPPAIMWMFMTGRFDDAVQHGIAEQAVKGDYYDGTYEMVPADAEMLITHGVEPKETAPSCSACHDNSGSTPDGAGMVPFDALGYHQVPAAVKSCTLCHERKSSGWESMHSRHRGSYTLSCQGCHTPEPTGIKAGACTSCHGSKSWRYDEGHKKHYSEKRVDCVRCHTFS